MLLIYFVFFIVANAPNNTIDPACSAALEEWFRSLPPPNNEGDDDDDEQLFQDFMKRFVIWKNT